MDKIYKKRGSGTDPLFCIASFAVVTAVVSLIYQAGLSFGPVLIPATWGLGAILPLRSGEGDLLTFGVTTPHWQKNLKYYLLSSAVIFPLFAVGFRLYVHEDLSPTVNTFFGGVSLPRWLLYNFLAVALFEELFFRGFVQGRFENFVKARFMSPAAVFCVPILISSFLFALAHAAVYLDHLRLVVFFPGLLFGWLRAKTGSLLAPILSHGTANLVFMLLLGSVS
jgi:membrane protease YdiL (CAAX protease family)